MDVGFSVQVSPEMAESTDLTDGEGSSAVRRRGSWAVELPPSRVAAAEVAQLTYPTREESRSFLERIASGGGEVPSPKNSIFE